MIELPPPASRLVGPRRRVLLALVTTILVASAGCAGIAGSDGPPTGTPSPAAGTATAPSAVATGTTAPETATETTTDGHSPDGSHSHDATATPGGDATPGTPGEAAATGKLTVVVAGEEVTSATGVETGSNAFWFDDGEPHTWHAAEGVTLGQALETLGVDATAETLTYDGTTYDDAESGTTVNVRVDGDPVDPKTYTLADGDEVWVTVETPEMDVSTPGEYIQREDQHIHGHLEFAVDGERVAFSQDRYQSNDRYFHFEGGDAAPWHAHSYTLTLDYALSTLDGIDVSADGTTLTYDGTTYDDADPDTTVRIEVNGEAVEPGEYLLKDGDGIRVVIETGS